MARTGRRPGPGQGAGASTTARDSILAAARAAFGASGYDGASLRAIASAAGVDQALIHHYFGTKERLFAAATWLPLDLEAARGLVAAGPPEELGGRLVRFFMSLWEDPVRRQILLSHLRTAATDPAAATLFRNVILEGRVMPVLAEAGVTDSVWRATLVGSQLIGLCFARYLLGVEPLASASIDELVAAVGPTVQRYVTGSLEAETKTDGLSSGEWL